MIRVLLVTSPNEQCGIREHSEMLKEAVEAADPSVEVTLWGNPEPNLSLLSLTDADIVHLDHHAALHAAWNEEWVRSLHELNRKVVVTQHDTFETKAIMDERGMTDFTSADALVVHEPIEGLTDRVCGDCALTFCLDNGPYPARCTRCAGGSHPLHANVHYIRQGVPDLPPDIPVATEIKAHRDRPIVGTVGFPFPWKRYDLLCSEAAKAGWGVRLIAPNATVEDCTRWCELNEWVEIDAGFPSRDETIRLLRDCEATAFLYSTGNSGTSAAIRLGIAARKPMLATPCRQFRDLYFLGDEQAPVPLKNCAITWCDDSMISAILGGVSRSPSLATKSMEELADTESWREKAMQYLEVYRGLVG